MVKARDIAIVAGLIALGGGIFFGGRALSKSISDFKFPELPSFPDIKFPDINLPDITLPEINFPEFKFPDIFGGGSGVTQVTTPAPPDFVPLTPEEQEKLPGPCSIVQDEFGNVTRICAGDESPTINPQQFAPGETNVPGPPASNQILQQVIQQEVGTSIPGQEFFGGGPSFIGGFVGETPIANLSLSQIIDKFNVPANIADDIRRAAQGFPSLQTGFVPEGFVPGLPQNILRDFGINLGTNISDPRFSGFTSEQIRDALISGAA